MTYFISGLVALLLSVYFTIRVKKLSFRFNIVDKPDFARKIHQKPIPLLGGLAVFLAYFLTIFLFRKHLLVGDLSINHWASFALGALFLLIGGILDDKYNLSPKWQFIWPILASLVVVLGGVSIDKISNPWGSFLFLPFWISSVFIFLWILGMTYTTKLLDGLDGLASGVSAIGALIIFLFTISSKYYQPDIALASIVFFGVLLGFLIFNFNPAKIFLGESGSLLLGYILGVLAIISGGKIAVALLVMGLPILDVLWTIIRRMFSGKNPFKHSDRGHLHHRLIDLGLSQKQAVLFFYFVSGFFGFSALFLQSRGKFWALLGLVFIMVGIIIFFHLLDKKKNKLLLHICCAPCGAYLISEKLLKKFDITLYFYNSNINNLEEYQKRLFWVEKMARNYNLKLEVEPYNHVSWLDKVRGMESEPEGGARCSVCYFDRLEKTAKLAKEKGINNFYTTLVTSPYKDYERIMEIGNKLAKDNNLNFLNLDFDRSDLYKKSVELAKKEDFYRQKYCGCEFSRK
ncbi:MAG: epoxyqueuosine reductase QueH [Patescibacteria group bacterium]|nr:epoxyqueuosine reductase QueH [Patescibacteria group bacterium]